MKPETLREWLHQLEQQHTKAIDLGLERIQPVAAKLLPDKPDATVITVAGTNGKGSFVAAMAAILQAHGKRVACYTSPHLLHFNERISINGVRATDQTITRAFEQVMAASEGISLSYFEFTTLAALLIFTEQSVDYMLLEVGLGGRLDAVNIIAPDWAVITSIGLDHQQYLGDTRSAIAAEKAGILRQHTPLVCAEPEMIELLPAVDNGRPLWLLGRDFMLNWHGENWDFVSGDNSAFACLTLPDNGLSFNSQAAAIMLARQLPGLVIDPLVLTQVLAHTQLPGRFQRIISENNVTVIADVAHNTQAASLLKKRLRAMARANGIRRVAVFHILDDKDEAALLQVLADEFDAWFVGKLEHARASSCHDLADSIRLYTGKSVTVSDSIAEAFALALSSSKPGDEIVAFGSFFVVAELLQELDCL